MKLLLVDLSSLFRPIFEMSGKEADQDYASKATVARVHELAQGFDGVAVCCDSRKSWRKELAPTYKAQRPPTEEPLRHQLRLAQEQLEADGFPVWTADGFEADDVIAAACSWALADVGSAAEVVIASSDKDLCQLVDGQISVKSLRTGDVMGPDGVVAKFGVKPSQMRDWLCLVGDSSDNVKGVPGIGPKRATALLQEHGSLFELYSKLGDSCTVLGLTPSMFSALKENVAAVELARKLITLRTDVELPFADIFKPRVAKATSATTYEELDEMETKDGEIIDETTGEVTTPSEPAPKADVVDIQVKTTEKEKSKSPAFDEPSSALAVVEWSKQLEPRSTKGAMATALALFATKHFQGFGSPEAIFSTIMLGRELGIGAMSSVRGIHLIETKTGKRHTLSADLMAGLVLSSGKAKYFDPVELEPTHATYTTHRIGSAKPFTLTFKLEEAITAGLVKKDGNWEKWAVDMCKARVVARLARAVYPDVCFGLYVPEEFQEAA